MTLAFNFRVFSVAAFRKTCNILVLEIVSASSTRLHEADANFVDCRSVWLQECCGNVSRSDFKSGKLTPRLQKSVVFALRTYLASRMNCELDKCGP